VIVVPRGQAVTLDNPALDFAYASANAASALASGEQSIPPGYLQDVTALSFAVFDASTPAKRAAPVQVYPTLPTASVPVDLEACALGVGRYILPWSPSAAEPVGRHFARTWCTTPVPGAAVQVADREFEVATPEVAAVARDGYCLVSDLRAEGLLETEYDDTRVGMIIAQCSRMIERYTGRWFEPRYQALLMNGRNARKLFLDHPIVAVESVAVEGVAQQPSDIVVYNRHLQSRMTMPDDRDNPKIEFRHSYGEFWTGTYWSSWSARLGAFFPYGQQNVEVVGLFGYTDWDGSAIGKTPDLIRHCCKLMVIRELPQMTDHDEREDRRQRHRYTGETTDKQSRTLQPLEVGMFTGDPEIDRILSSYARGPMVRGI